MGAGLGASMQTMTTLAQSEVPRTLRRAAGLVIIGLFHGLFLFHGDILLTYGLVGLVLLGTRMISARAAAVTAGVLVGTMGLVILLLGLLTAAMEPTLGESDLQTVPPAFDLAGSPVTVLAHNISLYPMTMIDALFLVLGIPLLGAALLLLAACSQDRPRPTPIEIVEEAKLIAQVRKPASNATVLGARPLQIEVHTADLSGFNLSGHGYVVRQDGIKLDSVAHQFSARGDTTGLFIYQVPDLPTNTQLDISGLAFGTNGEQFEGAAVSVIVERPDFPTMRHLPRTFTLRDEMYQYRSPYSRDKVDVLARLDAIVDDARRHRTPQAYCTTRPRTEMSPAGGPHDRTDRLSPTQPRAADGESLTRQGAPGGRCGRHRAGDRDRRRPGWRR